MPNAIIQVAVWFEADDAEQTDRKADQMAREAAAWLFEREDVDMAEATVIRSG